MSSLPIHLLTCPQRAASCADTLNRWDQTDWGRETGRPRLHLDSAPDTMDWGQPARGMRIVSAFAAMLTAAMRGDLMNTEGPRDRADWILFLEDDLDFHPHIGALVFSWEVLNDPRCAMATLFNPGLQEVRSGPSAPLASSTGNQQLATSNSSFLTPPATFLGAQALLLRPAFITFALAHWADPAGSNLMQSQRLARILTISPWSAGGIAVHRPSLIQHLPVEGGSGWGARVQTAADFNKAWKME